MAAILYVENYCFKLSGADQSCNLTHSTVCNGPLQPNRRYQIAYRAQSGESLSPLTQFGGGFATEPLNSTGKNLYINN